MTDRGERSTKSDYDLPQHIWTAIDPQEVRFDSGNGFFIVNRQRRHARKLASWSLRVGAPQVVDIFKSSTEGQSGYQEVVYGMTNGWSDRTRSSGNIADYLERIRHMSPAMISLEYRDQEVGGVILRFDRDAVARLGRVPMLSVVGDGVTPEYVRGLLTPTASEELTPHIDELVGAIPLPVAAS